MSNFSLLEFQPKSGSRASTASASVSMIPAHPGPSFTQRVATTSSGSIPNDVCQRGHLRLWKTSLAHQGWCLESDHAAKEAFPNTSTRRNRRIMLSR
jgi:hypothetical protein